MSDDKLQKISWESYKTELHLMSIKTKEVKKKLLNEGKKASRWATLIGYPAKILLTLTATGGGIQIFSEGKENEEWITILRTILEIIVLILVTTKDSFNFEKKKEKYFLAAKSMDTFHELVRFQTFQVKGMEGDRYEVLKDLKEMYAEIVQNNQIIQMIESVSGDVTPLEMESQSFTDSDDDLQTANNSPTPPRRFSKVVRFEGEESPIQRTQQTNDRNRMFYLHKMIEDIN